MFAHPKKNLKRDLGAYYTPKELCTLLADFVVRSKDDSILEPSFGGSGLLIESINKLKLLESEKPEKQVFGCDIDPHAFDFLPNVVGRKIGKPSRRFVLGDFLSQEKNSFMENEFKVIIANPPYIGYRQMSDEQRQAGERIRKRFGLTGSRYAGTWYYFLIHSLSFLKENGRVAFVLPYALVDSDYAASLRVFIGEHFSRCAVFAFSERLFLEQGTRERIVVLLADGWRREGGVTGRLDAIHVDGIKDFQVKLKEFNRELKPSHYLGSTIGGVKGRISNSSVSLLNSIKANALTSSLGDHINVKIGLVAGNIGYFTFNKAKMNNHFFAINKHLSPVMRSLKNNLGLKFEESDFERSSERGDHVYLLRYHKNLLKDRKYLDYLDEFNAAEIRSNKTLRSRDIWHEVDDKAIPDFFIAYMNIHGPRMVINKHNVNCFNNTHRGYLKEKKSETIKKLLALSVLTSFTQTIAELESKQYGSKTLKMEPSMYSKLPILLPLHSNHRSVTATFNQVDKLLRNKEWQSATDLASLFIYKNVFNESEALDIFEKTKKIHQNLESTRRQ